jgi:hypothetical protein
MIKGVKMLFPVVLFIIFAYLPLIPTLSSTSVKMLFPVVLFIIFVYLPLIPTLSSSSVKTGNNIFTDDDERVDIKGGKQRL